MSRRASAFGLALMMSALAAVTLRAVPAMAADAALPIAPSRIDSTVAGAAISPSTDFSFDFQDLDFRKVSPTAAAR